MRLHIRIALQWSGVLIEYFHFMLSALQIHWIEIKIGTIFHYSYHLVLLVRIMKTTSSKLFLIRLPGIVHATEGGKIYLTKTICFLTTKMH